MRKSENGHSPLLSLFHLLTPSARFANLEGFTCFPHKKPRFYLWLKLEKAAIHFGEFASPVLALLFHAFPPGPFCWGWKSKSSSPRRCQMSSFSSDPTTNIPTAQLCLLLHFFPLFPGETVSLGVAIACVWTSLLTQ